MTSLRIIIRYENYDGEIRTQKGLKSGCTNPRASYTNSESGVWRVVSGGPILVSQAENIGRGSLSAGVTGRTNSGRGNGFLSGAGRASAAGRRRRHYGAGGDSRHINRRP